MAVPKKRTGHSAQGSRRANWKATKPETTKCPNCGATVLAHTVCTECGTYKGQPVRLADKAAAAVAAEAPAKKTTKKSTTTKKTTAKKTTKKAAAKAEETKVEETKAEEVSEEKTEE
jgi:large subunit ribosomal protein L32